MNELEIHEMFMQRCIEIAKKIPIYTLTPLGALIVKNNKIISEGCTRLWWLSRRSQCN